jgi:hypothetical protein
VGDSYIFCVKEQGSGVHDEVIGMSKKGERLRKDGLGCL